MTTLIVGAFVVLFALLFAGLPIAFGLGAVGVAGFAAVVGLKPALAMAGQVTFDTVLSYSFSVLPLFLLMGNLVARSGLAQELYDAAHAYVGHRRGGLAMATIIACGAFAAVCGSSIATAATMSKVAMPAMRRYGYDDGLAAGAIAGGGTLGILIPPSVILVLYGIMTETDIGKLFIAGIVPGVLGILLYVLAIAVATWRRPELGPPGLPTDWRGRLRSLRSVWGILLLFLLVLGGIYLGIFTPTEAAGIGASGAFLMALGRRSLQLSELIAVLIETARTTTMMFILLCGAIMFSNFLEVAGLPAHLSEWVGDLPVAPIVVILAIVLIYLALGCILESLSMMLLTVPIFFPVVVGLGYDAIWFGILLVVAIEVSLITPPIGLNVFMLKAMLPDVPLRTIFRGVVPFIGADIVRLVLLLLLPSLALFLPNYM